MEVSVTYPPDRLGVEVSPGCFIAYGHALGRCAGLRIGKVLAVKPADPYSYSKWRITVRGVDDDWSHVPPKLCSRNGTLQFPERMVVLNGDNLPDIYLKLLADV